MAPIVMRTVRPCSYAYRFQYLCGQKRKARGFSEVLLITYQTTRHHTLEDCVSVVTNRPMRTSRLVLSIGRFKSIDIKTNFHVLTSTFTCRVKRLMQILGSLIKAGHNTERGGCDPPPPPNRNLKHFDLLDTNI
jgi:hypothetical protein